MNAKEIHKVEMQARRERQLARGPAQVRIRPKRQNGKLWGVLPFTYDRECARRLRQCAISTSL